MAESLLHVLKPGPTDDLRAKCSKKLTSRSDGVLAMNAASATCPACKAVWQVELELERYKRGLIRPDTQKYYDWAAGPDAGISSRTIVQALTGASVLDRWRPMPPADPDDFGRCYRMLQRFPELKPRIGELAAAQPEWAGLIASWAELEALYEEELPSGVAPKLWARMQELSRG